MNLSSGLAPIHVAASGTSLYCLKLVVESGADVRLKATKTKRNALHIAVVKQKKNFVEYLLGTDADIDNADTNGQTPLQLAHILQSPNREEFVQMFYSKVENFFLIAIIQIRFNVYYCGAPS